MTEILPSSPPFNARYDGSCSLSACERRQAIEPGDVCVYLDDELFHHACARRVQRDQVDPLCTLCYCYHNGECA